MRRCRNLRRGVDTEATHITPCTRCRSTPTPTLPHILSPAPPLLTLHASRVPAHQLLVSRTAHRYASLPQREPEPLQQGAVPTQATRCALGACCVPSHCAASCLRYVSTGVMRLGLASIASGDLCCVLSKSLAIEHAFEQKLVSRLQACYTMATLLTRIATCVSVSSWSHLNPASTTVLLPHQRVV